MKIVLVGYMGSGKSTIGKLLSEKLYYEFVDLDDRIEELSKMKIQEIFFVKGELYFRKLENVTLFKTLSTPENQVISLGGGTPCYYNNYELYYNKESVLSIYLLGKIDTLFNRLKDEKSNRPIISSLSDIELNEFIGKHLFERNPYYRKVDKVISIDGKTSNDIVNEILNLLA